MAFGHFHTVSLALVMALSCGFSLVARAETSPVTCATCHTERDKQFRASVHASLDCQACHQGDSSYEVADQKLSQLVEAAAALAAGQKPGVTFDHGRSFGGAVSREDVPERCGVCHADVVRMNPYGLRTDPLARYWTGVHGQALKEQGDDRVAVCTDCHGSHDVRPKHDPASRTHPLNVPGTCSACHADAALMGEFDVPVEVVGEYRQSVHGRLLFEQGDAGAPTCATCHGHHGATPPGFATVVAVCSKCHQHVADNFSMSIHAGHEEHKGCVQCHGGGANRRFHLIERITKPAGVMIQRYKHLLQSTTAPTPAQITEAIHPDPKQIINNALETCMACHEDIEDDESLPRLFELLDKIADAERTYVATARRLDRIGQGVLPVDRQRFLFEDAKTHLIELAPLQHTLDNDKVASKVADLRAVCEQVNAELSDLERNLAWRRGALIPIWIFAGGFSIALYLKYKQLKAQYVKPVGDVSSGDSAR